jgi:hypothetical protein
VVVSGETPNSPDPNTTEPPLRSVQDLLPALIELASIQHDLMDEIMSQTNPENTYKHHYRTREGLQALNIKIRLPQLFALRQRSTKLLQWLLVKISTQ